MSVSAREILKLSIPALGVLAATPLYLLLDTAVVGRLGTFELAALAAAASVQSTVTTQLTFLSYGTTARSSRLFGQGKRAEAVEEGVQATWVGLSVGTLLAIIIWLFGLPIAKAMTGDDAVAHETAQWLYISAFAIPLTLTIMAGNGWLRGIQDTRRPLYFVLAGIIPAALLLYPLVSWLGLRGSAVANVLGMAISAACFLVCLAREHTGGWAPRLDIIGKQLVLGRDLILRSLSFQVAFLSAAAVAARFGAASLAAHQIMLQVWNFISLVLDSLAIAAQTLVGAALGRGTAKTARQVGDQVTRYSMAFSVLLGAIFAAGYRVIPRLFTTSPDVLAQLATPWWQLILLILLGGVVFALDGVLLGAGDAAFLRTITLGAVALGFLPGVWLSYALHGGLVGVWWGLVAFIALRMAAVVWRFRSMKWAV